MSNQTLKDVNCLVSCVGLYADIEDDSLKQYFNMMTQELGQDMKRIRDFFQKLDTFERLKGNIFLTLGKVDQYP